MIIVGINGGGTKTEALCCNEEGKITGRSVSGSSNYHNVGMDTAVSNIKTAVLKAAKLRPDMICVALAGMDTKRDYKKVYKRLSREYKNLILENDAFAELYGEVRGKSGILAIAGTGSVVLGYDGKRRYHRANKGWFLGDEGSGYFIGKEALKVTARMLIEGMKKTQIADRVMSHLGLSTPDDLVEWVYSDKNTVTSVAGIAKTTCRCAEKGDRNAKEIVNLSSYLLATNAVEIAKKLSLKSVYIKGGLTKSRLYYSNFSATLRRKGIRCIMVRQKHAQGALLIAADRAAINAKIN